MDALLIVLFVAAILAVVLVIARFVVGWLRRSGTAKVAARFGEGEVVLQDPLANFFGLESKGGRQLRGNGVLVLTWERLWFSRAGSRQPLEIPRAGIRGADLAGSHAGKAIGRDLLRVEFDGPGGPDAAAWYVTDPQAWLTALRAG